MNKLTINLATYSKDKLSFIPVVVPPLGLPIDVIPYGLPLYDPVPVWVSQVLGSG